MRYQDLIMESVHDLEDAETPEEIQQMLEEMDAREVTFPRSGQPTVYIVGDDVVEWDGTDIYPQVTSVYDWIYRVDVEKYYPDHDARFNREFWKYPSSLFHATTQEHVEQIKREGLLPQNKTRGIGNRSVGGAVFTTANYEETVGGSYGEFVFEIDTRAMAADGVRPYVSQEPPVIEYNLRSALAHQIGLEDFEQDSESGMSEETVIVHGAIPPKYLSLD